MVDREVHDIILDQLKDIRADIKLIHTPDSCPLGVTVKEQGQRLTVIEKREAWRSGAWAVVGLALGTLFAVTGKEILRWVKSLL